MKMVAAAKLRRAQDAIIQMRPYAKKLGEMLATVSAGAETAAESPFKQVRSVEKVLIVTVTSDRGLCGAFNTNVIKAATLLIQEKYATQAAKGNVEVLALGKKGGEAFLRRGFTVNTAYMDVYSCLSGRLRFVPGNTSSRSLSLWCVITELLLAMPNTCAPVSFDSSDSLIACAASRASI